jgi:hypothetical protein
VRTVAAEGDVIVGLAPDVEGVRMREDALITVGGGIQEEDLVAGVDRLTAQLDVARRRAVHVLNRRYPAQHLLHRCRDSGRILEEHAALRGVADELLHAA